MFIISLTYKVNLEEVNKELNHHIQFLEKQYAAGSFSASGRKVPRTGGVILSQIKNRHRLEKIIEEDPFYKNNIADYELTEFIPSKTSEELKFLLEED